jgi:signal transduction histidine kinase
VRRALIRHRDPARQSLAVAVADLPPLLGSDLARPARAGEPVLLPVVTPRQLASLADTDEHRRALAWLGVRSLVVVPLRVRDRTLGALTCVYGRGGRRYEAEDLPLAQELALRAALAIDHARLYAAERTARAEAEAAVRVREEFLAVAAHELKTPVTSLRGFAELGVRAMDAKGGLDPSLARRTLETIDRQSARLAALVANLLEVARSSADQDAIVPRRVNLADLARSVVEAARIRAPQHQIVLDAPDTLDVVVDPLRIEQVLTNLVDNAVKYSPAGGAIEVAVRTAPESAELVIRDHGLGIPREHQHRIFDRFFQAHAGEHASGMGLGLYISQKIVRHHGGTIRAEAPEDGGTRMIVWLPREASPPLAAEPSRSAGQRSA